MWIKQKLKYRDDFMNSFLILDSAITFATRAHSCAYRKGTQTPYILHRRYEQNNKLFSANIIFE